MAHTSTREEIAGNVRALMARRRVSVATIAELIGKSQPSASERINGHTNFRVDELQVIAAHLEVPLEELLAPAAAEAAS